MLRASREARARICLRKETRVLRARRVGHFRRKVSTFDLVEESAQRTRADRIRNFRLARVYRRARTRGRMSLRSLRQVCKQPRKNFFRVDAKVAAVRPFEPGLVLATVTAATAIVDS